MLAAGVTPAIANLLANLDTSAATDQLLAAVLHLLEVLLRQGKAAAIAALKSEVLPALAAMYAHCCSNSVQPDVNGVLLLMLKPSTVPTAGQVPTASNTAHANVQVTASGAAGAVRPANGKACDVVYTAAAGGCQQGLQDVQEELGRCCSTGTLQASMQLLAQGGLRKDTMFLGPNNALLCMRQLLAGRMTALCCWILQGLCRCLLSLTTP